MVWILIPPRSHGRCSCRVQACVFLIFNMCLPQNFPAPQRISQPSGTDLPGFQGLQFERGSRKLTGRGGSAQNT